MLKEEVRGELTRTPFVPVSLHLDDGRRFDVPFRDVAQLRGKTILLLIGLKEGTRQAKTFKTFAVDWIDRVEPMPAGGGKQRRKGA